MRELFDTWRSIFYITMRSFISKFESSRLEPRENADDGNSRGYCLSMLILWSILFIFYEKCLHLLLRRMQYPLVKRRKIINSLWSTGFTLISMFYMKFNVPGSIDSACSLNKPRYLDISIVLHKSFYLHNAGIEIIYHGDWLRGWTNLVFCLIIHSSSQLKWFDIVIDLLIFKATSMAIINICRLLWVINSKRRKIVKFFLAIYLGNLIYVHSLVVPDFTLWNSKGIKNDVITLICMWIWLFMEFLNEIKNIRLGYLNADKWIEAYLFVPPSQESIELRAICRKLREISSDKIPENIDNRKAAQLWQTLSCAMLMKKKVKRLRETKENTASTSS